MKMKCSHCKKSFDYENYYGLCPKCGTYNKRPEESGKSSYQPEREHEKLHKFYGEKDVHKTPGESELKGHMVLVIVVCALITAVLLGFSAFYLVRAVCYEQADKNRPDTTQVEIMKANPDNMIVTDELEFVCGELFLVADSRENEDMPEGTKLVALWGDYKVYDDAKARVKGDHRTIPYVYDGKEYREYTSREEACSMAQEAGIYEYVIDEYDIYHFDTCSGYLLFLVDEDAKELTVSVEDREDSNLKKIYDLTLPIHEDMEKIEIPSGTDEETYGEGV